MRAHSLLLGLSLISTAAMAADAPAAAPVAFPPQWSHAVPVSTLIGADVAAGLDAQGNPANLILKVTDLSRLSPTVANAAECVVEADAWSNLSAERVTVRPRLLRCFDGNGKELASRALRGFAVDKDARAGVKGSLLWGQTAKDLMLLGVGVQAKQNFLMRTAKSALGRVSMGLTDNLGNEDDKKPHIEADAIREVRSSETLLPNLQIEPGREFGLVLSTVQ